LALTCGLVNESNVRVLVRELLNFLMTAEGDMKEDCVENLCSITVTHSPSPRWQVDTSIRVMELADQEQDTLLSTFIQLVASSSELQGYATQKLYIACCEVESEADGRRESLCNLGSLLKATFWCLGEFGHLLVNGQGGIEDEEPIQVSEGEVIELAERVLMDNTVPAEARVYGLTCLVKLANRFSQGSLTQIRELVSPFMANKDMEVQQRAIEFTQLLAKSELWDKVLAPVPAASNQGDDCMHEQMSLASSSTQPAPVQAPSGGMDDLDDLMGLGSMTSTPAPAPASSGGLDDLLGDLLGDMGGPPAPAPVQSQGSPGGLESLLGGLDMGAQPPAQQPGMATHVGYQKNGLTITFDCKRNATNPGMITLRATYLNQSAGAMSNFGIQTAVPKEMKLRLQPISSSNIVQGGTAQQLIDIMNPQNVALRIMMKIQFVLNGQQVQDQAVAQGFPNF